MTSKLITIASILAGLLTCAFCEYYLEWNKFLACLVGWLVHLPLGLLFAAYFHSAAHFASAQQKADEIEKWYISKPHLKGKMLSALSFIMLAHVISILIAIICSLAGFSSTMCLAVYFLTSNILSVTIKRRFNVSSVN